MDQEDRDIAMQNAVRQLLSSVHTCLPGTVVSYDGTRATVRPVLSKLIADGRILPAPAIVSVPVIWPTAAGGKARLSLPLAAGDGVLLHFSERSLEGWHDAGNPVPDDPRQYDLSDAIAMPGLNPDSVKVPVDTTNLAMVFGDAYLKITPDGQGLAHFPGGFKLTGSPMKTDSTIDADGDVRSRGISLPGHVHEDAGGDGLSGQPV